MSLDQEGTDQTRKAPLKHTSITSLTSFTGNIQESAAWNEF
jgi:hypothetical protein